MSVYLAQQIAGAAALAVTVWPIAVILRGIFRKAPTDDT
jgi:hypothetical protein